MLLRQLEYFVALAREQHFARAASVCFVSQPALSESIRKLEHELGVPLVKRGRCFEALTPEGERLVSWARRILADQDALKQEVAGMQSGLNGRLRLSVVPSAATTAALLIEPFCSAHPLATVHLETSLSTADVMTRLDRFELDAGIVYLEPQPRPDHEPVHLFTERMVLVASHHLVPDVVEQLAWSELAELPVCALNRSMRDRQRLDDALGEHGLTLRPEVETDSIASICSLAATGRWAGVVPHPWLHSFAISPDIRFVPLVAPTVTSPVGLVTAPSEPGSVLGKALATVGKASALDELFRSVLSPFGRRWPDADDDGPIGTGAGVGVASDGRSGSRHS